MTRTAINLYTVRDLDEPLLDVLDRIADAGYDGVQFAGFGEPTVAEVLDKLEETGLTPVSGAHVGLEDLQRNLEETRATFQERLGCDSAVLSYLDESYFADSETTDETISMVHRLSEKVEDSGWRLHYHNHDQEFVDLGDETGLDRLLRVATDVGLELDVGWALTGGEDPVTLLERYDDRIEMVHMKDMADGEFCEIGEGNVDMQACADTARDVGATWLIYEHDQPSDPAASLYHGAAYLNDL
ncbi:sugar phosphate isomerase/epimerase [Haladaptatus sp. AB618]|uniref:sugar phosphate isomerase/epimerase family protein n=1 Tax=Haladaptatus sp. AB618 TaxID=2934173 RepID=UPI00209C6B2A|nr:sugar phosphate isomerase/epimerase [Haladaptatus sp. AB618]